MFQSADLIATPALILLQATDRFRYRSMKNEILLENYYLPGQLETAIGHFVEYYHHERYHESLNDLKPADVYYGCGTNILRRWCPDRSWAFSGKSGDGAVGRARAM